MIIMSDSVEDTKAGLRALVRERLAPLRPGERSRLSAAACRLALEYAPLASARAVLAFIPMRSEVDVEPLIEALLNRGVTVCAPRADWLSCRIEPVPITDLSRDLDLVERGVRQPRADLPAIDHRRLDVVLVPGVAFDEQGGRLGRGGGFYDRVLGDPARRARALGIAFEAQVLERIPMEAHDRPVDALATPARLMEFGATERAGVTG